MSQSDMYTSLLQISKLDYKTKMDASKEASILYKNNCFGI